MKYREAVFIVTYYLDKDKNPMYLLLKRKLHWHGWEFPKGGVRKGETLLGTLKRELREETGLKPIKITKYNIKGKYKYNKVLKDRPGIIGQTYTLYSAEMKDRKVKIDKKEHSGFVWKDFNTALKLLTWPNQKKCLRIVNKNLNKK